MSESGEALSEFARGVLRVVARVPRGRVVSYGGVALLMGRPRAGRGVGSVLQSLPDDVDLPWWRVINGRGEISPGGSRHRVQLQRTLLRREGVRFDRRGRVDWEKYGWNGTDG